MSAARALLERCREAGLQVQLDGEQLRLRRPKGPPPPKLLAALREAKPDVVAYLRDARTAHVHPCARCGRFCYPEPAVICFGCRQGEAAVITAARPEQLAAVIREIHRVAPGTRLPPVSMRIPEHLPPEAWRAVGELLRSLPDEEAAPVPELA